MNCRSCLSLVVTVSCTVANFSQANHTLRGNSEVHRGTAAAPSPFEPSFLDIDSLRSHESAILSSLLSNQHRSLQANNCMQDNFDGGTLTCTANDIELIAITGVEVFDAGAYLDTDGLWKDGCRGTDDYVNLAFTADIRIRNARYDIGMYINTEGGLATTGTCAISLISETDFLGGEPIETYTDANGDTVEIGEFEDPKDKCPDVRGGGLLTNYAFQPVSE